MACERLNQSVSGRRGEEQTEGMGTLGRRQGTACNAAWRKASMSKTETSEQRLEGGETVSNAQGHVGSGRALQAERMACTKALRPEHARCVEGTARRPMRLEQSPQGGDGGKEDSATDTWRGGKVPPRPLSGLWLSMTPEGSH